MLLPVNLTIVAQAEVAPKEPYVITTSLDGFISDVLVKPNKNVRKGQVLYKLDQISLQNELDKAEQALKVAEEKYRQAYHQFYAGRSEETQIAFLKAEVEKNRNDVAYHKQLLERSVVRAPAEGHIIFSSVKELIGQPVKVGEQIMLLAIDDNKELDIRVPASDMLQFSSGDKVRFYPNIDPLSTILAKVDYVSAQATIDNQNQLTFFMVAQFLENNNEKIPTFGSRGTAKIDHGKVSLFYYLFRRPIIYIRSLFGW
jgi:multidrug resistance efflux pump